MKREPSSFTKVIQAVTTLNIYDACLLFLNGLRVHMEELKTRMKPPSFYGSFIKLVQNLIRL